MRGEVQRTFDDGSVATCQLLLLELWDGAQGAEEAKFLRRFEHDAEALPITEGVWELAKELARRCGNRV